MAASSRLHLAGLGRLAPARCQRRILLELVHKAQATRFGRDHDFRRIRGIDDYRRLVPLYSRAELWREYWQPVYPHLAGATWPQSSAAVQAAHRSALRTALALAGHVRPRARLLSGAWLFLTDEGPSSRTEHAILTERLPALIRPYTVASVEIDAERFAYLPVTGLIGPAERLLLLMEKIKQVRGKRCLRDVWPELSAILYTRRPSDGPASRMGAEADKDVLLLEMVGRAEGPIAVADPHHGLLRLLFDHGVYFEFVPPAQDEEPRCPRYGIEEIELGVPYELALTSPAGLWACRLGRTVCLERRDPPLVRFLETAIRKPTAAEIRRPARRTDLMLPTDPSPEPHPQSAGSPAALPENSFHSPWSIHADQG
ncbi:MAG TPA: GH3 auxin-responsive promoter family protein [Gemmataceae bacterium]|nr:GH3 auxin-responsive promoter family protein [Gemmataceae bacterium]